MKYYINKGYKYTKTREKFYVKIKDLSPNSHVPITAICDICKKEFVTNNNQLSRAKRDYDVCYDCKSYKMIETKREKARDKTWEDLDNIFKPKGYKIITPKEQFVNRKQIIEYLCPKHGIVTGSIHNLLRGHGCSYCARESNTDACRNSGEKVSKYINSINNNILLNPEDYKNSDCHNLQILCGCCSKQIFITSFSSYKHGTQRCAFCSKSCSSNELKIRNILDKNDIRYIPEKTFSDCKDKGLLFFDFYLPDYNLCIEYDGEQHYNIHYDETINKSTAKEQFENRKRHDKIKDNYCIEKGINMLRIPYWEENNLEEIILNKIRTLK